MSDNHSKTFNELNQLAHVAEAWQANIKSQLSKTAYAIAFVVFVSNILLKSATRSQSKYTGSQYSAYARIREGNDQDKPDREKCDIYRDFLNNADHNIGIMMRLFGSRKLAHALPDPLDNKDKKAQLAESHNYKNFQKLLTASP